MCEKSLNEVKDKILKTRELATKAKKPEDKQKAEQIVDALKQKCIPIMRQKKEIAELMNNPY